MHDPALTQEKPEMQTDRDRLTPDDLTMLATGETTLRAVERPHKRDEVQTYFDGLVTEAYKKWTDAGKPSVRRERPALRVDARTEEQAKEVWARLRNSAVYLNVGISLDPIHRIGEGRWRVTFSSQDKRKRTPKAG
jgi:hypothetical protein